MDFNEKLKTVSGWQGSGYWADRIASELLYLFRLSVVRGGAFDDDIERACDFVLEAAGRSGVGRSEVEFA